MHIPSENPFANSTVAVFGDAVVDRYIYGGSERLSREAPIPVIRVSRHAANLACAGNAAANVKSLGATPLFIARVGTSADSATGVLRALCAEQDISTQHLVESAAPITSKNRLISMHQQVARFDEDHVVVPDDITRTRLIEQLTAVRKRTNVVVISDYGYNTADRGLIEAVLELWKDGIVIQDPQSHRPNDYTGVHGTTPNRGEAAYLLGESHVPPNTDEAAADTCKRLKEKLKLRFVLLTRSEKGMTLLDEKNDLHHFPALARQLADVSGAGDTVIATLASALAVNMSLVDAVRYANAAGAVSVAKPGVARVSWDELREELLHTGSNTPAEAVRLVRVK